jgi:hypothetical protein
MREARLIADQLVRNDIYRIKHHRKVWGKVDPPPISNRNTSANYDSLWRHYPNFPYYVLDTEPEFMSLEDQQEEAAGTITQLRALEFLCRPAVREGEVSQEVVPLAIADAITDPDTGAYQFPDQDQDAALIAQTQHALAARFGVPMEVVLKEQEARLKQVTSHAIRLAASPPLRGAGNGRQPVSLPDAQTIEGHTAKQIPSRPLPDDTERQFLTFISEHPDTPISALYKALGVSVWKGNEIRDSLKAKGLLAEVAIKTGKAGAGRPAKFVLLTFQAYTLFGIQPPAGRGGVIHRHLQQLIAEGATAKGYTAQVEKELGNGAIVDVHLEKPSEKIAVEFAVVSTPEREIRHIKECIAAGYDQVYALFADENLLARTATALTASFSEQEAEKVRLLPLSQLPHVG